MSPLSAPRDHDEADRAQRYHRRLLQELGVRASVAVVILVFDLFFDLATRGGGNRLVRLAALVGLFANVVYYVAVRFAPWRRTQAYLRMMIDIELITLGLYGAGGLAAGPYLGVYSLVTVYAGLVFSSRACLLATGLAAGSYLGVTLLDSRARVAAATIVGGAWGIAAFNLLIVAIVGVLTAMLAEAYRRSRLRLATLNRELEHANDESLRLNAEIQRSARLSVLGEGIASVAHELNNVMNVVAGRISLVQVSRAEMAPAVADHLDKAREACESATRILRTTLHSVREGSREKGLVSLPDIARRTVELKAHDFRRDAIAVRVRFAEDLPDVLGVSFQLQQVLLNLVTNAQHALRASGAPRSIEITGTAEGEHVVVEVCDSGPGIPPEALRQIFKPFFTTKPEGTGLGLAVSAAIIRDHGGQLAADNRPAGGAVFRIKLPLAAQSSPHR